LKNIDIPEYYLGGNVEFLGDSWKNQDLALATSARAYFQDIIPKLENLFEKSWNPSRHSRVRVTIWDRWHTSSYWCRIS
jgi:thymidylate synthase